MVALARELVPAKVDVRVGDVTAVHLPADHYDAVTSSSAMHHVELTGVLPRLAETLRPGGLLIAVALPKTATTNLPSSVEDPIILSITREGLYYINETPVARGLLKERLGAFLKSRKDRTVFLKADRALSYGTVVETLDVLNRMGIENLGMITETPGNRKSSR